MMQGEAGEDNVKTLAASFDSVEQISTPQVDRAAKKVEIAFGVHKRSVGEIVAYIATNRTVFHRLSQVTRAAATQVEDFKWRISVTIGEKVPHVPEYVVMVHVVVSQDLVIDGPLVEEARFGF